MSKIPVLTIYRRKLGGKPWILSSGDILSLNASKSRQSAAGSWNATFTGRWAEDFKTLDYDDLVVLERYAPGRSGDPELLMVGLISGKNDGWSRSQDGKVSLNYSISGQDMGRLFIEHEQYIPPYLGVIGMPAFEDAFEGKLMFGAGSYEHISGGDPSIIIPNIVEVLMLGQSKHPKWGANIMMSDGRYMGEWLDMSNIQPMADADPDVFWTYVVDDGSTLFGKVWTVLEKYVQKQLQELWIDSVRTKDGPAASLNFRLSPYWAHDRRDAWDALLPTATHVTEDQIIGDQGSWTDSSRYNWYELYASRMFSGEQHADQFMLQTYTANYPANMGGQFDIQMPIIERWHKNRHGLRKLRTESHALPFDFPLPGAPAGETTKKIFESLARLSLRLWDYWGVSHRMRPGQFSFHGGLDPWPRINTRMDVEYAGGRTMEYYIQNSAIGWQQRRAWATKCQLIRGITRDDFWEAMAERNMNYMEQGFEARV